MVVRIDGSAHTGGGGLLRVALGLSMLTGEPFSMTNIRSARPKPGLGHQHLTAVRLAARMCSACVEGAELGSEKLLFIPSRIEADTYELDIGTAGSIALALQPVLLAAAFSGKRFVFHLKGGTDVPYAPSADFLRAVFLPSIRSIARNEVEIAERGFFPKGGGRMIVRIASDYSILAPAPALDFATPSAPVKLEFRIATSIDGFEDVREHLILAGRSIGIDTTAHVAFTRAADQGISSTIIVHQGRPVRAIGHSTLERDDLANTLFTAAKQLLTKPCDEHLADQLIPYISFHSGAIAHPLTDHMRAAIEVCDAFLPGRLYVDEENGIVRSP